MEGRAGGEAMTDDLAHDMEGIGSALVGRRRLMGGWGLLGAMLTVLWVAAAVAPCRAGEDTHERAALLERLAARTRFAHEAASPGEGRRVRLIYYAPVNVETFWRFKTDFENDWLVSNRYIQAHRFIGRRGNVVVTETKYTHGPDVFFRWESRLFPESHTLRYTLLNPAECGQLYHRGVVTLASEGNLTRVRHTSQFAFAGAFIWAYLPGPAGMAEFFRYTARWEQETVLRLQVRYAE
jgi:hypothetical protein